MKQEIWKTIPEYEHYQVSDLGNVRTTIRRNKECQHGKVRPIKPSNDTPSPIQGHGSYKVFTARSNNVAKRMFVHRAVLLAFVGPCPEGMVSCHNDGTRYNNRLDNLRWDTIKSNTQDQKKHGVLAGLKRRGENASNTKLKESDVVEIKELLKWGMRQWEIGYMYGVHSITICNINTGSTWRHVK